MKHILQIFTIFAALFYVCIVQIGFAQQKQHSIEWSRCYGGSRNENGNSFLLNKRTCLPTPDGGFIFAAQTSSRDGDIDISRRHNDMFQQDSFENEDIWIVKLSSGGSIEWEQYYGGEATDDVNCMVPTSDGGYILCGYTGSFKGDFPIDTTGIFHILAGGGFPDGFVMKVDSLGRKEWVSRIGGSSFDILSTVIQTSDGSYLATGETSSTDELWLGLPWIRHNGGPWQDAFVVKLAPDGSKKWIRFYGGTGRDGFLSMLEKPEGGFILCGGTNSDDGDISKLHYKDSINSFEPTNDLWIVEISKTGTIIREKCFGGSSSDEGFDIHLTNDGGYIVAGQTLSPDGDVAGYHPENKDYIGTASDSWIFKIDTSWNIIWQNCIGGSQQEYITSLIPTRNGGYAFIGSTNSSDSDLTGIHKPENKGDIWIGELSSVGKLLWQQCFGGTGTSVDYGGDFGNGIIENDDGGFTLYASVGSTDGDIVGNHGGEPVHNRDIWVAKLRPGQVGVSASTGETHFANPYPNPSVDQMNLYIHPTEPVEQVQFFNPLGQEFYPKYQLSGNLLTTNTETLAEGIYIVRITYKDLSVQEVRKFVKMK